MLAKPAVTNLLSPLEWDRQMFCPITFQVFLHSIYKHFIWALYQMDVFGMSKRFEKHSI